MTAIYNSMAALPHFSSDLSSTPLSVELSRTQSPMNEELIRSASFTAIPILASPAYSKEKEPTKGFALDDLSLPSPTKRDSFNGALTLVEDNREEQKAERIGRRKSLMARPKSWMQQVKTSQERKASPDRAYNATIEALDVPPIPKLTRTESKAGSHSFASYARRSWMSSSRSPSPNKARGKDSERSSQEDESTPPSSISSSSPTTSTAKPSLKEKKQSPSRTSKSPVRKATSFLHKKRPRSALFSTNLHSADGSFISINKSSTETPQTSTEKLPALPKGVDFEKSSEPPRRRDELWTAFRALETDFSKFQAKTSAMKTNVVRATLLPFLRNCAQHASNKTLRPEDLDRRVNILNKWWTGILEM